MKSKSVGQVIRVKIFSAISVTVNVNCYNKDKSDKQWIDKNLSGLYQMVGIVYDRPIFRVCSINHGDIKTFQIQLYITYFLFHRKEETQDGQEIRLLFNHRRYDPSNKSWRHSWGIESWNWEQPDTANYRYLDGKKLKLYIYSKGLPRDLNFS